MPPILFLRFISGSNVWRRVSSPALLVTPGRPRTLGLAFVVAYSNFCGRLRCLNSKGLKDSRIEARAEAFCAWCEAFFDCDFFSFLDFCGPVMPWSRSEALRRLSCEGGIVAGARWEVVTSDS